jgi:hypothetical protein
VPAATSRTSDGSSTLTIPDRPVRSRTTPPWTGTDAPHTPLRPAAAVTGTRASWHSARTAATSSADDGRATAAASPATWPSVAQAMAPGHQSRLASATMAASTDTSVQALARRSTRSSGTSTRVAPRWDVAAAAPPARAMGGVGAPGPSGGRGWGAVMRRR